MGTCYYKEVRVMKKINFETSKGKFVVVDIKEFDNIGVSRIGIDINGIFFSGAKGIIQLKKITEQQASEIVDSEYNQSKYGQYEPNAIHRLYSIITSNGYHLFENPYTDAQKYSESKYFDAEDKTFYNPIIFKLV